MEVATLCFSEFEGYLSDKRWDGLDEDVTHVTAKIGHLLDTGQRNTLPTLYFVW